MTRTIAYQLPEPTTVTLCLRWKGALGAILEVEEDNRGVRVAGVAFKKAGVCDGGNREKSVGK